MNARLLLLVLITGLFMAAWDGDQAAMQAALARHEQRIADARLARKMEAASDVVTAWAPITDTELATELTESLTLAAKQQDDATTAEPVAQAEEIAEPSVPLPPGIAAGNYQAVNQTDGSSVRLTVEQDGSQTPRDFYTVDDEQGDRWYIIRIADGGVTAL